MKAVRITEAGVAVVDVPRPEGEGVRLRPRATGICGSDLKFAEAGAMPATLGHEVAGLLDDGTAVALEPLKGCGVCDRCAIGVRSQCRQVGVHFYGVGLDGGMAEEMLVAPACLVPLASTVRLAEACLVEPLGVAVHACVRAKVEPGMKVAVIGGGAIGLCTIVAAHAAGCEVDLEARYDRQWQAAERLGAGRGLKGEYDVVFDAAGSQRALEQAAVVTKPGGVILLEATYFGQIVLPGLAISTKEITLIPSMTYACHAGGREMDSAAALLAQNPELGSAVITHRYGLDEAAEAFRVAADRRSGVIKVVIEA